MREYTQEQMNVMSEALKAYKAYRDVRDSVLDGITSPLDPAVTNYVNTVPYEVRRDLGDRLDGAVELLGSNAVQIKLLTPSKDKRLNSYEKMARDSVLDGR